MPFFLLIHIPVFLYLLIRFVLPLKASRMSRLLVALLLLLISQHYALRMFFGYMSTPEMPAHFIALEGWAFACVVFFFVLLVLSDTALLLRRALLRNKKRSGAFSPDRRKLMLALAASLPAAYGVGKAMALPVVGGGEVFLPRLAPALDGLTLVQLTDLHASPLFDRGWMRALVERVNALKPDIIVFTGDLADGRARRRLPDLEPLGDLQAGYGLFGCVGNHEYYSGYHDMLEILQSLGVHLLLNAHTVLRLKGTELVLAGVTDQAAARFGLPEPDVAAALKGAPQGAPRILLDHRPGNAAANALAGADLQLSGHTHGGHILGMDRLVARFNAGYVRGWYKVNDMALYVSPGTGLWNGFPLRIGVPGEISRLQLFWGHHT